MTRTISGGAVGFTPARAADVETELLAIPVFEGEDVAARVPGLDEAAAGTVRRAAASRELQGKLFELFLAPIVSGWRAQRVALVGAGKAEEFTMERLRRVASAAGLAARQRHIARIAVLYRGDIEAAAG